MIVECGFLEGFAVTAWLEYQCLARPFAIFNALQCDILIFPERKRPFNL
jgi:hypothetical protein